MSKRQTEILLSLSFQEVIKACELAANTLGWRITQKHPAGLTCVQIAPTPLATGNPVTVEVVISTASDNATLVTLKGKNFGFGPFQSSYVIKRLQEFSAAIEQAITQRESPEAKPGSRNVVINGVRLTDEQVQMLEQRYHTQVNDGAYWYDRICGAWGAKDGPTLGFIEAGLEIGGPLREDASKGDTGVFINGRELHQRDVLGLQQLGPVLPGRYWVDALGNVGWEGGMMFANLWQLAQQRRSSGARTGGPWAVYAGGGVAAGDGEGGLFAQFGNNTWSNW